MAEKEKIQEMPEGWKKASLKSISKITMGQSPSSDFVNENEIGMPFLQGNAEFTDKHPKEIFWVTKPKKIAQRMDILLSVRAPVGETNIADKTYCIGRGLSSIRFTECSDYYGWYLIQFFKNQLIKTSQGSTFTAVNKDDISAIHVIYPINYPEQHTIASILSICDEAIEKTDAKIEKLKRIKQGLMQDLFRYGIDENGKMRSEATHHFKNSPLGRIPEEWEVKTLEDVVNHIGSGVTPTGGEAVYQKEGIKFIRSQNVTFKGIFEDDIAYISESIHKRMQRSEIYSFDILLNITGASIGRCCVVPEYFGKANVNQHVCAIRLLERDLWLSSFVSYFLQSHLGQKQIDILNAGGNREGLNYQQIRTFHIYWPKKPERSRIASVLSSADESIKKEEAYKQKLLAIKRGLMDDLLSGKVRVNKLIKEAA